MDDNFIGIIALFFYEDQYKYACYAFLMFIYAPNYIRICWHNWLKSIMYDMIYMVDRLYTCVNVVNTLCISLIYSERQDVVTQMYNSSGKCIKGMHLCIGRLMRLIIIYTQSLSKMFDILYAWVTPGSSDQE